MLKVVTLRWTNTAINAGNITIQRKLDSGEYVLLGELDPNVEQYIDIMEIDDLPAFESVTYEVNTTAVVAGETRVGEPGTITLTQAELGDIDNSEADIHLGIIRSGDSEEVPSTASIVFYGYKFVESSSNQLEITPNVYLVNGENRELVEQYTVINLAPNTTYRLETDSPVEDLQYCQLELVLDNVHLNKFANTTINRTVLSGSTLLSVPAEAPLPPTENYLGLYEQFASCTIVDSTNLEQWDLTGFQRLSGMFMRTTFDATLSNWDVSNITSMDGMFQGSTFNGNISDWDVSKVTSMESMFRNSPFNGDISGWNVSSIASSDSMNYMFYDAKNFDQGLSQWCVANVMSTPTGFSTGAPLTAEHTPVWGTCPRGENQQ